MNKEEIRDLFKKRDEDLFVTYEQEKLVKENKFLIPKEWSLDGTTEKYVLRSRLPFELQKFGINYREYHRRWFNNAVNWEDSNHNKVSQPSALRDFAERIKPFPHNWKEGEDFPIYPREYLKQGDYYIIPKEWNLYGDEDIPVYYKRISLYLSYQGVSVQEYYNRWFENMKDWEEPNVKHCKRCGAPLKFRRLRYGYATYCGTDCANKYKAEHPEEFPIYEEYLRNGGGFGLIMNDLRNSVKSDEFRIVGDVNLKDFGIFRQVVINLAQSRGFSGFTHVYGKLLPFRSKLEYSFLKWLQETYPNVRELRYEPFKIGYLFGDNIKSYYPDYLVTFDDGTTTIFEVKMSKHFEDEEVKAKVEFATTYCERLGYFFCLFSEDDLDKEYEIQDNERIEHFIEIINKVGDNYTTNRSIINNF